MVPGEILHDALARGDAHARDDFGMIVKMPDCVRETIDIARRHDDAFHAVDDHIARFARRDLRQTARGRFVGDFGAAFASGGEGVDRSLFEVILRILHEANDANIIAPKTLEMRLRFLMHGTDEPQLGVLQFQPMPRFEEMMDAFAFDQCAGKYDAEDVGSRAGLEALDVDAARQIEEFLFWKTAHAEGLGGFFGKHDEQIREVVFFDETFALQEKSIFPITLPLRGPRAGPIAMPGRDFHERGDAALARDAQRFQAIARPTMEEIVAAGGQLPRGDPIEIFLLRAVVVGAIDEGRNQTHGMPAERLNERAGDFALPVIVGDGATEEAATMRRAQGFKRVGIQAGAADAGEDRVEQMLRKHPRLRRGSWRRPLV